MQPLQAETQILIGLIKALSEQSQHLTGEFKMQLRNDFNMWQKRGFEIVEQLEKQNKLHEEHINSITDIYHNINIEIRKTLLNDPH